VGFGHLVWTAQWAKNVLSIANRFSDVSGTRRKAAHDSNAAMRYHRCADGILRKDCAMGDKSPKNTSKTKKQKAQKKAASAPRPAPKK
jgi:hypothetical protein